MKISELPEYHPNCKTTYGVDMGKGQSIGIATIHYYGQDGKLQFIGQVHDLKVDYGFDDFRRFSVDGVMVDNPDVSNKEGDKNMRKEGCGPSDMLVTYQATKLEKDDLVLVKAGLTDTNGILTEAGQELLLQVLLNENKAAFVTAAQSVLDLAKSVKE